VILSQLLTFAHIFLSFTGGRFGHISAHHDLSADPLCALLCIYTACHISCGSDRWDVDAPVVGKLVLLLRTVYFVYTIGRLRVGMSISVSLSLAPSFDID